MGGTLGTSNSYSVSIEGDNFTAINITFQNTVVNDGSVANQQAVALRTNGDRQSFYHCKILGYQDTYYSYSLGRVYMKNCYIEGSVDFIFGQSTVVFDSCEFLVNREGGVLTAASTNVNSKFGYVFKNCKIHDNKNGFNGSISKIYLGRPWQGNPKVVFLSCEEPSIIAPEGWTSMNSGLNPLFAEYNCSGPGYKPYQRSTNPDYSGIQLTDEQAAQYTIKNIFSKNTNPAFGIDWVPDTNFTAKIPQEIIFPEINTFSGTINLEAFASSGLEVYYTSSDSDIVQISGNQATVNHPGTVTITAHQPGNFLYNPAEPVSQTINVLTSDIKKTPDKIQITLYPNPSSGKIYVNGIMGNTLIEIFSISGEFLNQMEIKSGQIDCTGLKQGIYLLKIGNNYHKLVIR
ncbi:Por secretion system C-terminal sorting domain-containing protein [Thermophagus xiamenensis]|uniref:Pectinesterase n=1 Tax=Thermophagus xiamenensis TaxID=385682 RepID=A0A1I1XDV1_9BACT|nr:Por secretion system C-terminal sorting domain-containing protein [Thermophagus xiamenensis]